MEEPPPPTPDPREFLSNQCALDVSIISGSPSHKNVTLQILNFMPVS